MAEAEVITALIRTANLQGAAAEIPENFSVLSEIRKGAGKRHTEYRVRTTTMMKLTMRQIKKEIRHN